MNLRLLSHVAFHLDIWRVVEDFTCLAKLQGDEGKCTAPLTFSLRFVVKGSSDCECIQIVLLPPPPTCYRTALSLSPLISSRKSFFQNTSDMQGNEGRAACDSFGSFSARDGSDKAQNPLSPDPARGSSCFEAKDGHKPSEALFSIVGGLVDRQNQFQHEVDAQLSAIRAWGDSLKQVSTAHENGQLQLNTTHGREGCPSQPLSPTMGSGQMNWEPLSGLQNQGQDFERLVAPLSYQPTHDSMDGWLASSHDTQSGGTAAMPSQSGFLQFDYPFAPCGALAPSHQSDDQQLNLPMQYGDGSFYEERNCQQNEGPCGAMLFPSQFYPSYAPTPEVSPSFTPNMPYQRQGGLSSQSLSGSQAEPGSASNENNTGNSLRSVSHARDTAADVNDLYIQGGSSAGSPGSPSEFDLWRNTPLWDIMASDMMHMGPNTHHEQTWQSQNECGLTQSIGVVTGHYSRCTYATFITSPEPMCRFKGTSLSHTGYITGSRN